jgi:hypothetical protein
MAEGEYVAAQYICPEGGSDNGISINGNGSDCFADFLLRRADVAVNNCVTLHLGIQARVSVFLRFSLVNRDGGTWLE